MSKRKDIILDCGIEATTWNNGDEYLDISLHGLLNGYGEENDFLLLSKLFLELNNKGFVGQGCSTVEGYYGAIDNLILTVRRIK
jgi:hypothetical protein